MVRLTYVAAATLAGSATAIDLDITSQESIQNAAATVAYNTMSYYTGNQTGQIPGYLNSSWWEGGALFNTMIQYWYFTGDASNNPAVSQGLYFQRGNDNYMPSNWSSYMGNDDQMSWALAAMTAAELDFPQGTDMPSWASLAERVFDMQAARWDSNTCGGGLRWQIWPYEAGYTYKNAISNGGLFQLAARLARYTNNQTYSDWAERVWDWSVNSLIDEEWTVADTTTTDKNCSTFSKVQWTYNYATYVSGAAYMYNYTNGETAKWKTGLDGLLNTTFSTFFPEKYGGNIMSEVTCEPTHVCNDAESTYKGLLAGDLAFVSVVAPYTASEILPRLQGSAVGAAKQCSGGDSGTVCGQRWYQSTWDGWSGIEESMSATSIITSTLVAYKEQIPATQATATNQTVSANGTVTGNGTTASTASGSSSGVVKNGASALAYGPFGVIAAVVAAVIA
ncbi:glycosyl hydrolase family 76 protein [Aspergillus sclerotioniger CBS 115572]|uniref:Mannan endo-1,6-alpha-mannosidase n=1 Tax=Aspergillus sclerotioniger CBS 115572 TaxID=1450535 RepID=A0A317VLL8_9EURO|nr:glycosyl hydrolase family 76 protein [Aspergillus sclerotioniger CBS 115572]PWY75264.1 glycosyl hydrolase family 76 protein [Aspergillus sclerotioniger CBS 115572]